MQQNGPHHRGASAPKKVSVTVRETDAAAGTSIETYSSAKADTPHKSAGNVSSNSPATSNSRYVTILAETLPSLGSFYDLETFSIRKFDLLDIKKIHRANATRNLRTLIEVINASVEGADVFTFTPGDFWMLMYWHRINSFMESPLDVTWDCDHPDHLKKIKDGTLPKESVHNSYRVQGTDIQNHYLANHEEIAAMIHKSVADYKFALTSPRIADQMEGTEMLERITDIENTMLQEMNAEQAKTGKIDITPTMVAKLADKTAEYKDEEWYNNLASMIDRGPGVTLEAKRAFLDGLAAEGHGNALTLMFREFEDLIDHGVTETVKVKCAGCGACTESSLSVEVFAFFPAV